MATINLPMPAVLGQEYFIKKGTNDGNTVTIDAGVGNSIVSNGVTGAAQTLVLPGSTKTTAHLVYTGSNVWEQL